MILIRLADPGGVLLTPEPETRRIPLPRSRRGVFTGPRCGRADLPAGAAMPAAEPDRGPANVSTIERGVAVPLLDIGGMICSSREPGSGETSPIDVTDMSLVTPAEPKRRSEEGEDGAVRGASPALSQASDRSLSPVSRQLEAQDVLAALGGPKGVSLPPPKTPAGKKDSANEDKKKAPKRQTGSRCPSICVDFGRSLGKYHLVISILATGAHPQFTRPQRATVAATTLLLEMAGAAVATRFLSCEDNMMLYVGACSSVICAPLAYALAKLFVVTGQKYHESADFLRDYAMQKKKQAHGDPAARAKLQQMVTHDKELAEISARSKFGRCLQRWNRRRKACFGWTKRCIKSKFSANPQDEDLRSNASARSVSPGAGHLKDSNEERDLMRKRQQEASMIVTDAGGLTGGSSLPPEATFRYYLWRWLHHAIYCCCLLIALVGAFQVIFYGMKFDDSHVWCWLTGCGAAIAFDYLILQPVVAGWRQCSDVRYAKKMRKQMARKRAVMGANVAFQQKAGPLQGKTEWSADDFGAA